jgi:hypothetical protein
MAMVGMQDVLQGRHCFSQHIPLLANRGKASTCFQERRKTKREETEVAIKAVIRGGGAETIPMIQEVFLFSLQPHFNDNHYPIVICLHFQRL